MDPYAGFEPRVGEVRAVRTFRIGPDGRLYPLYADTPWASGTNTAHCRAIGGAAAEREDHDAPEPGCTCGFYAYADEPPPAEQPFAQHVLAVVSCWGRIVAGTRGLRAEHARIDAIWMSGRVPPVLAGQVAERYPTVAIHQDKDVMLAEHELTRLDCYEPIGPRPRTGARVTITALLLVALGLGCLPANWLWRDQEARLLWLIEVVGFVCAAGALLHKAPAATRRAAALVCVAATLWLLAPFAGAPGVLLLRLPMVQIAVLALVERSRAARIAGQFPARIGAAGV
jgi:hypothetical protein